MEELTPKDIKKLNTKIGLIWLLRNEEVIPRKAIRYFDYTRKLRRLPTPPASSAGWSTSRTGMAASNSFHSLHCRSCGPFDNSDTRRIGWESRTAAILTGARTPFSRCPRCSPLTSWPPSDRCGGPLEKADACTKGQHWRHAYTIGQLIFLRSLGKDDFR